MNDDFKFTIISSSGRSGTEVAIAEIRNLPVPAGRPALVGPFSQDEKAPMIKKKAYLTQNVR